MLICNLVDWKQCLNRKSALLVTLFTVDSLFLRAYLSGQEFTTRLELRVIIMVVSLPEIRVNYVNLF